MAVKIERKYVLTKIAAGDYLLPSNDGDVLWRFVKNDGEFEGWSIYRWDPEHNEKPLYELDTTHADPDDWNQWQNYGLAQSRQEAIEHALSMS